MTQLLDTNILIDYLRDKIEAVEFVEALRSKPATSVCTVIELMSGAKSRSEEVRIEKLSRVVRLLPVVEEIAWSAGRHLKHYQRSHGLDDIDAIIAATAEHHQLELATQNVKHFPMFGRLKRPY